MERECFIVGGGPSLKNFNFPDLENKDVIAVNQSIFHLPKAKYFVTIDYTWLLKAGIKEKPQPNIWRIFANHPAKKFFVLTIIGDRLKLIDNEHFIDTKFDLKYDLTSFNEIVKISKHSGIGFSFDDFRGGSDSGFAGLQLAVALGYTKIFLLGFDLCLSGSKTHYHEDYVRKNPVNFQKKLNVYLNSYYEAFQILRKNGVEVYSCSPISKLNQYILYRDIRGLL